MTVCRRARRWSTVLLPAVALVASCSADPEAARLASRPPVVEQTSSTAVPTTAAPTTTLAPTTTAAPTTTLAPTTTVPPTIMQLTGLPASDPLHVLRRALVVKIDNHPEARPQFGLNAADIVFEENVEGLTRFAAVFHSTDADQVGPIRSGRTQDVDLLGGLNRPLFAWSGGNEGTKAALRASDLIDVGPYAVEGSVYFRDRRGNESLEHTLYSSTTRLWSQAPEGFSPPPAQFEYRGAAERALGEPSTGLDVAMDGVDVRWLWDDTSRLYLRFQGGREHFDALLGQLSAANVVVLEVRYQPSPADEKSPEAQTVGSGAAWVVSDGTLRRGSWERADRRSPFTLIDSEGRTIRLTPGRTWVELARVGRVAPLV